MNTLRQCLAVLLPMMLAFSAVPLAQERHAVDPAALAATVNQYVVDQDSDRAAVREALARPEVREMASRMGLDADRLAASASTFTGSDLERAAAAARDVNRSLVGGANVVISTTTIIIILLVIILLVVAIK
jgi:hypothetical protein